jgi:hypothetical protein
VLKYLALSSIVALSITSFANRLYAQTNGVGAGIIIGGPTGISGKFWTSNSNAIDLSLGWSNSGAWTRFGTGYVYYSTETLFHFNADYVWHSFHVIESRERFPLYYGVGLHFDDGNTVPTAFGVRAVGGIEWMPRTVPLDIFLEIAPVFYMSPTTGMGMDAGFGARYFFN